MGMIKDIKVKTAADAAAKATASGRRVLAYRQNIPMSKSGWSGEIGDMGEVIEVIETGGWQLSEMAYDGHQSSNGGCIMIFRRAAPQPPQQQPQGRPAAAQQPPGQYGAPRTPPQWQGQPQGRW